MKYRKKPVEVDALEWNGGNMTAMYNFLEGKECKTSFDIKAEGEHFYIDHRKVNGGLIIKTLEGEHIASQGDFIIKGVKGEFYPCKPDIFKLTYDEVL